MKNNPLMWMIRAGEYALLFKEFQDNNIVAVGWNRLEDFSKYKNKDEIKTTLKKQYPEFKKKKIDLHAGLINTFTNIVKKTNWVITYSPDKEMYLIGKIVSDYQFHKEFYKYHHIREVVWLKKLKRDKLTIKTKRFLDSGIAIYKLNKFAMTEIFTILNMNDEEIKRTIENIFSISKRLYVYRCKNCKRISLSSRIKNHTAKCNFCFQKRLWRKKKKTKGKYVLCNDIWIKESRIPSESYDFLFSICDKILPRKNYIKMELPPSHQGLYKNTIYSDFVTLMSRFYENCWSLHRDIIYKRYPATKNIIFEVLNKSEFFRKEKSNFYFDITRLKKKINRKSHKKSKIQKKKEQKGQVLDIEGNEIFPFDLIDNKIKDIQKDDFFSPDMRCERDGRIGQFALRQITLSNYENKCAVCKVDMVDFLVTSHIVKWCEDKNNRLNPHNVLCLCVFHDKAFEKGMFIIVEVGGRLKIKVQTEKISSKIIKQYLEEIDNSYLRIPKEYPPDFLFLKKHRLRFLDDI